MIGRDRAMTAPVLIALAVAVAAAGCRANATERAREYMPDMTRGPAYKAFAPNPATADGLTLQRPVAHTIPRGFQPFHYGRTEDEAIRAGRELRNPHRPTARTLDEGRALYQTYCLVCHGSQGKGDGPIAGKVPPPPSYRSARLLTFPAGRIFHVVSVGAGKMPSYAAQLTADERWKVVAYVRASLQGLADDDAAAAARPASNGAAPAEAKP